MARRSTRAQAEFTLFNVVYEDDTLSSNRKVASAMLEGPDADDVAKAAIEAQDREIAERSGRPRGAIKSIEKLRVPRK